MRDQLLRNQLLLEPTSTAQWKQLLTDAEQQCDCSLDEDIESYLVFTLMRFSRNPRLAQGALAPEYFNQRDLFGQARQQQLRDVGDQCLLITGLFPQLADKRLVSVSYYVDMGRSAYHHLSELLRQAFAHLYHHLANNFVQMMDVLQNIRHEPALQPLQAMSLWQDTGSRNAYRLINPDSSAIPVNLRPGLRQ